VLARKIAGFSSRHVQTAIPSGDQAIDAARLPTWQDAHWRVFSIQGDYTPEAAEVMSATARSLGPLHRECLQMGHDGLTGAQLADLLIAVKDGHDVAAHVVAQPAGALFPEVAPAVPIHTALLR